MSAGNPREELAGIARSLRTHLERERAAGTAELLAASARAAARRAESRAGTSGPAKSPRDRSFDLAPAEEASIGTPRASKRPAAPPPKSAAPAPLPHVDLFGNPVAVAVARAEEPEPLDFDLPPVHAPLNPAGLAERAQITERSLPVLGQIAEEVIACTRCGLCETRTNAVPGVGSGRSGIVFVGEAPGADEDRRGEPFVGRAGELLTRIIKAMDDAQLIDGVPLTRDTVYICNVLKCRPPENRNPLPHEIETCSPYLQRQLAALEPRLICCLGKFAAELLVGAKGTVASMRGRTYRYHGAKLIVTYHPAACLRNPNLKRPVWEDMQLLAREYQSD